MDKAAEEVKNAITNGIDLIREGAGISATLVTFIVQICATLMLFLAVRFLLWNKVTAMLDNRKEAIALALTKKDEMIAETNALKEEASSIITRAYDEGLAKKQEIINQANNEATMIITDAKDQASHMLEDTKADILKQYQNAKEDIKEEIVSVAYLLSKKLTDENLDEKQNQKIIDDFFKEEKADD